jgi:hypothetical protein
VVEFERPWAFPNINNDHSPNRVEPNNTMSGPYPVGEIPNVLLRTDGPGSNRLRYDYQNAMTPSETDQLNEGFIGHGATDANGPVNPLGDPIIFSSYLIGQVVGNPGWQPGAAKDLTADFNLDADRGFGYLCWDWNRDIRGMSKTQSTMTVDGVSLQFIDPCVWPEGATFSPTKRWDHNLNPPMLLHYKKVPDPGCVAQAPPPPSAGMFRATPSRPISAAALAPATPKTSAARQTIRRKSTATPRTPKRGK